MLTWGRVKSPNDNRGDPKANLDPKSLNSKLGALKLDLGSLQVHK